MHLLFVAIRPDSQLSWCQSTTAPATRQDQGDEGLRNGADPDGNGVVPDAKTPDGNDREETRYTKPGSAMILITRNQRKMKNMGSFIALVQRSPLP